MPTDEELVELARNKPRDHNVGWPEIEPGTEFVGLWNEEGTEGSLVQAVHYEQDAFRRVDVYDRPMIEVVRFKADSHNEAMQRWYNHNGWGEYRTPEEAAGVNEA